MHFDHFFKTNITQQKKERIFFILPIKFEHVLVFGIILNLNQSL